MQSMKEVTKIDRHNCCGDCKNFANAKVGKRGGKRGNCKVKYPNLIRCGSRIACKRFAVIQD